MTNFPTTLDTFNNPGASTAQNAPGYQHDAQHANLNDAVAALEAKVGVNDSTVATSLDYRIGQLENVSGQNTGAVSSVNGQTGAVILTSDTVAEGTTNLYFTSARARAAVSVSAPLNYISATGVISIVQAGQSADGYLSQTDWNTFNNKQSALGFTPLDIAGSNAMGATLDIAPSANSQAILVSNYSLTGSNTTAMLDLSGTWNTSGQPTAIKLNIADVASDLYSVLLDMQVDGNSMFRVNKIGELAATYYVNTDGQLLISGSGGTLYFYYPASGHNAITADDNGQTLTFTETGSDLTRAQLTAYSDFVFYDSTNGNQPCLAIRGDGSGTYSVGNIHAAQNLVFGSSGNTLWNPNNEQTVTLQVNSASSCAIGFITGDGTEWGYLGVRTGQTMFFHANDEQGTTGFSFETTLHYTILNLNANGGTGTLMEFWNPYGGNFLRLTSCNDNTIPNSLQAHCPFVAAELHAVNGYTGDIQVTNTSGSIVTMYFISGVLVGPGYY